MTPRTTLHNRAWAKDHLKCKPDQMGCNVAEYKKFTAIVSDSTLQVTFNKFPFVQFG